jgi:two-component system, LytTR family, response regulator
MTRPITVVIVDDEPLARDAVREALRADGDVTVVGEFGDGAAAIDGIRTLRPSLLFLDVQMPGIDGFGVLSELLPDELPAVVFVTAFDQYAVRAFDVHAIDYVLKPFDDARLARTMATVRQRLETEHWSVARGQVQALLEQFAPTVQAGTPAGAASRLARRVLVRDADDVMRFIRLDEVAYIEASGNYLNLYTAKAQHQVRLTLRALLPQLDPAVFRRIHRSIVVNVNAIREIQPWFAGDGLVVLLDGRTLRLSRTYREQLVRTLS